MQDYIACKLLSDDTSLSLRFEETHHTDEKLSKATIYLESDSGRKQGMYYILIKEAHNNYHKYHRYIYDNGEKIESKSYHSNGKPAEKMSLLHEKKNGPYRAWHSNGKAKEESTYVADNLHGTRKVWFENGVLEVTEYAHGKKM